MTLKGCLRYSEMIHPALFTRPLDSPASQQPSRWIKDLEFPVFLHPQHPRVQARAGERGRNARWNRPQVLNWQKSNCGSNHRLCRALGRGPPCPALPVPLRNKHSCQARRAVANQMSRDSEGPRDAACFPKTPASTQRDEGGDGAAQTQSAFGTGMKADRADRRPPPSTACLLQPWLHCPPVATQGKAGRCSPSAGRVSETRHPAVQPSGAALGHPPSRPRLHRAPARL